MPCAPRHKLISLFAVLLVSCSGGKASLPKMIEPPAGTSEALSDFLTICSTSMRDFDEGNKQAILLRWRLAENQHKVPEEAGIHHEFEKEINLADVMIELGETRFPHKVYRFCTLKVFDNANDDISLDIRMFDQLKGFSGLTYKDGEQTHGRWSSKTGSTIVTISLTILPSFSYITMGRDVTVKNTGK